MNEKQVVTCLMVGPGGKPRRGLGWPRMPPAMVDLGFGHRIVLVKIFIHSEIKCNKKTGNENMYKFIEFSIHNYKLTRGNFLPQFLL